jgi:hypothetical protein
MAVTMMAATAMKEAKIVVKVDGGEDGRWRRRW